MKRLSADEATATVATGIPRLTVDSLARLAPGRTVPTVDGDVLVVFEQMPDSLRPELVTGSVAADGSLSFALPSGGTVEFGPAEDVPAKLLAVQTALGGRIERRCLDVLDVREPTRLTIRRVPGCKVPAPTASATTASTVPSTTVPTGATTPKAVPASRKPNATTTTTVGRATRAPAATVPTATVAHSDSAHGDITHDEIAHRDTDHDRVTTGRFVR